MNLSAIKYDYDHPHEMKMVWDEWMRANKDSLPDSLINRMYDQWILGKQRVYIDQAVWSRIVVRHL